MLIAELDVQQYEYKTLINQYLASIPNAKKGSAAPALQRLSLAMALDGKATPDVRRWAGAVAAEIDGTLGQIDEATQRFREATARDADIPTLVAYADYLRDSGKPGEVLSLLADRSEIVLLRLAVAGSRLGDPRASHWSALLAERFAAARAGGVQLTRSIVD